MQRTEGSAYDDVCQETYKSTEYGYVKANFLGYRTMNTTIRSRPFSLHLRRRGGTAVAQGVTLKDITILVRKNKNIPPIADYFDKELHLSVVSDEAFRLDASLAICMLMDALRYLSNPENQIAKAQLAALMENYKLQMTNDLNSLIAERNR